MALKDLYLDIKLAVMKCCNGFARLFTQASPLKQHASIAQAQESPERTKQFTNNSKWAQQALERPRKRVK